MQALPGDPMPVKQEVDTVPGVTPRTSVRLRVDAAGWQDITATQYPA